MCFGYVMCSSIGLLLDYDNHVAVNATLGLILIAA